MQDQTSHFTDPSVSSIPWNEIMHHPHSFADPDGRVFLWGNQLYRGIYPAAEPFFRRLVENGLISNLVKQGLLVHTELTPFASKEFSLVFRHGLVPFASYPQEWCPLMLKDAALAIVDLAIELALAGLVLKDGHPWNVLFDACKPIYIDLGSIAENDSSIWPAYPDFCRYTLYPLILMSQGYDLMGRLLMCEDRGVRESELFRLAPQLAFKAYVRWPVSLMLSYAEKQLTSATNRILKKKSIAMASSSRQQTRSQKKLLGFLKQLRQFVESVSVSAFDFQRRVDENSIDPTQASHDAQALKREVFHRLLTELRPDSMLDISSDNGALAKQAAGLGTRVVCFETDPRKVTDLYKDAKRNGLPILPLFMDFTKPTPARGVGNHWAVAATERFQCDLVLALDFFDQPMPQRLGLEKIIRGLSQFSKRWLVLELPSDADTDCIQTERSQSNGFSMGSYVEILEKQFRSVVKMESSIKGNTLFVCEKH